VIGRSSFSRQRLRGNMTAFHHRNYRLFFAGQLVSLIGTWMQQVAQAWLVWELTGDPIWLGVVTTAQFVPVVILGLFAGVAADALPKQKVLLAAQISMMVLAFILAALVLSGVVEVWMIVVLAFLLGIANAVDMPARQSFVVELVGRDHVGNAVALNSAMFNGARIVGPAAAGLAIGAFGTAAAFLLNGLSFVAVIVGLWLIDERELETSTRIARPRTISAVVENLAEGLAYVRRTPVVLLAVTVVGIVATVGMNWNVLLPAFAQNELSSDASGFGFLMAASGIGSVLAALRLAVDRPRPTRLATGALILGIATVALAVSRIFPMSLGIMVVVGFGSILMAATGNTTIQVAVPDQLRGRVMSVYTTVFSASMPVGGIVFGAIASGFGSSIAIGIGGILTFMVGLAAIAWGRQGAFTLPASASGRSAQIPPTAFAVGPGVARPR
jgi:MFS family permease